MSLFNANKENKLFQARAVEGLYGRQLYVPYRVKYNTISLNSLNNYMQRQLQKYKEECNDGFIVRCEGNMELVCLDENEALKYAYDRAWDLANGNEFAVSEMDVRIQRFVLGEPIASSQFPDLHFTCFDEKGSDEQCERCGGKDHN